MRNTKDNLYGCLVDLRDATFTDIASLAISFPHYSFLNNVLFTTVCLVTMSKKIKILITMLLVLWLVKQKKSHSCRIYLEYSAVGSDKWPATRPYHRYIYKH